MSELYKVYDIITLICKIYGFTKTIDHKNSRDNTVTNWSSNAKECGWIKFIKYKTAAYFAFHMGQVLPPKPFSGDDKPGILLGGAQYRFMNKILKTEDRRSFLTSILYSKKGFPRPSKKDVKKSELETFEKLTGALKPMMRIQPMFTNWSDIHTQNLQIISSNHPIELQMQLNRTVDEIFENSTYTYLDRCQPFLPSTSANYINSRANAGAIGAIYEDSSILKGLRKAQNPIKIINEDDENMTRYTVSAKNLIVDTKDLEKTFSKFWLRVMNSALSEEPIAVPLGLQEALKVRVITKGPPMLYTLLKPLQKKMWNVLKSHKTFKLVGEPITEEYLSEILGSNLKENEYFLSGDYADATNNLKSWVSGTIAERISDKLKLYKVERRMFLNSLINHVIENPETKVKGQQTTGQLMGSITSFPILCIANAAICRAAHEAATGRIFKLKDCPLGINGDDLILKTNIEGYNIWKTLGQQIGLEESIGKTYLHKDYLNMNSTSYTYKPSRTSVLPNGKIAKRTFELVQYVNVGLLLNIQRSAGGDKRLEEATEWNTAARARELVRLTPPKLLKRVQPFFLKTMPKTNLPWFIPEWLGGIGLPKEMGTPSDLDLRMAHWILLNWKKKRPEKIKIPSLWKTRELAEKAVPKPLLQPQSLGGELAREEYERLLSLTGIGILFDSRVELSTLLREQPEAAVIKRKIRHNEVLWRPPKQKLPHPLAADEIEYAKKIEGYHVTWLSQYPDIKYRLDVPTTKFAQQNLEIDLD